MNSLKTNVLLLCKVVVGCLLIALAINMLYLPQKLLGGGFNGLAMLLHILVGVDTGLVYLICNIPLFIIGIFVLPKRFMLFTLLGIGLLSVSLSLTAGIHIDTQSPISAILMGGSFYGIGCGLIYGAGASTGGTDIIGKIIQRKYALNMATVGFAINFVIISISMYFFGVDISVYTLAAMFVTSKVSNFVIDGMNHKRMVFIISEDKEEELASEILKQLGRGVTILPGEGAYTGKPKKVMYCIIGVTQVAQLRTLVRSVDERAFVTITETAQVYGNGRGFYNVRDEI